MNGLLKIADLFDSVVRRVGLGCGWIILPLIFVIMFDVVTRKLDYTRLLFSDFTLEYGYSVSTILQDLEWHFHGVLLLMSFGVGYLANAHVRVDVFRELLPRQTQGWLELIGLALMATPFLIVLIWYSSVLWGLSFADNEGSESMTGVGLRWIIKIFLPIGFAVLLMAVVVTMIRVVAFLLGDEHAHYKAMDDLEIFADDHAALEAARLAAEEALRAEAEATNTKKGP